MKANLQERLTYLLEKHLISAYKVSLCTGVSEATLSRILSGKSVKPNSATIEALAKYFQVNEDWLLHGIGAETHTISAGDNSVIVQGNNKVGSINHYSESPEVLKARIALLEQLLEEKERTIQILMSQTNK